MAKIRVLLIDDHTLFRQGVRTLIAAEPEMEVVGEAANAGDAVIKAAELRPDIVLMDIGMPGVSCFEATRQIRALPGAGARTPIIALTANVMSHQREAYLAAGVDGVVGKPISPSALVAEILRVGGALPVEAS